LGKARGACYAIGGALRDKVSKKRNEKRRLASTKSLTLRGLARGKRRTEEKQESKTRKSSLVLEEEEEEGEKRGGSGRGDGRVKEKKGIGQVS
jgi:hypothetical protein